MMKTRKGTLRLLLIRYYKLTSVTQEAVLYPQAQRAAGKNTQKRGLHCLSTFFPHAIGLRLLHYTEILD